MLNVKIREAKSAGGQKDACGKPVEKSELRWILRTDSEEKNRSREHCWDAGCAPEIPQCEVRSGLALGWGWSAPSRRQVGEPGTVMEPCMETSYPGSLEGFVHTREHPLQPVRSPRTESRTSPWNFANSENT